MAQRNGGIILGNHTAFGYITGLRKTTSSVRDEHAQREHKGTIPKHRRPATNHALATVKQRKPMNLKNRTLPAIFAAIVITAVAATLLAWPPSGASAQSNRPPAPSSVAVSATAHDTVSVIWAAHPDGARDYRVAWTPDGENFKSRHNSSWNAFPTGTSHTITGLDGDTGYKVKVKARFDSGPSSDWTSVQNVTTPAAPQPTPEPSPEPTPEAAPQRIQEADFVGPPDCSELLHYQIVPSRGTVARAIEKYCLHTYYRYYLWNDTTDDTPVRITQTAARTETGSIAAKLTEWNTPTHTVWADLLQWSSTECLRKPIWVDTGFEDDQFGWVVGNWGLDPSENDYQYSASTKTAKRRTASLAFEKPTHDANTRTYTQQVTIDFGPSGAPCGTEADPLTVRVTTSSQLTNSVTCTGPAVDDVTRLSNRAQFTDGQRSRHLTCQIPDSVHRNNRVIVYPYDVSLSDSDYHPVDNGHTARNLPINDAELNLALHISANNAPPSQAADLVLTNQTATVTATIARSVRTDLTVDVEIPGAANRITTANTGSGNDWKGNIDIPAGQTSGSLLLEFVDDTAENLYDGSESLDVKATNVDQRLNGQASKLSTSVQTDFTLQDSDVQFRGCVAAKDHGTVTAASGDFSGLTFARVPVVQINEGNTKTLLVLWNQPGRSAAPTDGQCHILPDPDYPDAFSVQRNGDWTLQDGYYVADYEISAPADFYDGPDFFARGLIGEVTQRIVVGIIDATPNNAVTLDLRVAKRANATEACDSIASSMYRDAIAYQDEFNAHACFEIRGSNGAKHFHPYRFAALDADPFPSGAYTFHIESVNASTIKLKRGQQSITNITPGSSICSTCYVQKPNGAQITLHNDVVYTEARDATLSLSTTNKNIIEGQTKTVGFKLNKKPFDQVTVTLTSNTSQMRVNPRTLTFSRDNWDQHQNVVLSTNNSVPPDGTQATLTGAKAQGHSDYLFTFSKEYSLHNSGAEIGVSGSVSISFNNPNGRSNDYMDVGWRMPTTYPDQHCYIDYLAVNFKHRNLVTTNGYDVATDVDYEIYPGSWDDLTDLEDGETLSDVGFNDNGGFRITRNSGTDTYVFRMFFDFIENAGNSGTSVTYTVEPRVKCASTYTDGVSRSRTRSW